MKKINSKKLRYYRIMFSVTTLLGITLIFYMVKVESEPGLLPILILLTGISGLIYIQRKIKKTST